MIEKLTEPCQRPLPKEAEEGYVHPWPNRILHWFHALLIVFLAWTGLQIAHPGINITGFGVAWSVIAHKIAGVLLLIQMPIWVIYRIASKRLTWRCLPCWCDFYKCGWKQIKFYLFEIFVGKPHPFDPRELNPMQRITYVSIMLLVLPIAMISGAVLMWPGALAFAVNWTGDLQFWSVLHLIVAYVFIAFVLLHIYLASTGEKPFSYYKSMITGWVDKHEIEEYERLVKDKEEPKEPTQEVV